jgi:hypothetical protein
MNRLVLDRPPEERHMMLLQMHRHLGRALTRDSPEWALTFHIRAVLFWAGQRDEFPREERVSTND